MLQPPGKCISGNCLAAPLQDCQGYACADATSCKTVCAASADCDKDHYCKATVCLLKHSVGETCAAGEECGSSNCSSDNYCCSQPCTGNLCNGTMAGASTCASGTCAIANPVDCAPFLCSNGACTTMCTNGGDCAAGAKCSGIKCCSPCSAWINGNVVQTQLCTMSAMLSSGVLNCCKASAGCYSGGPCAAPCNQVTLMTPACEMCIDQPSECKLEIDLCLADQ